MLVAITNGDCGAVCIGGLIGSSEGVNTPGVITSTSSNVRWILLNSSLTNPSKATCLSRSCWSRNALPGSVCVLNTCIL